MTAESLNYEKVYRASRYDKGDADYLNCPFETKEEYLAFWEALRTAELAPVKEFEKKFFLKPVCLLKKWLAAVKIPCASVH